MKQHATAMLSSSVRDLPSHRQAIVDACLRRGVHPIAMEFFGPRDNSPLDGSLAMVDGADVLICVIGAHYGSVVPGLGMSFTEAEYRRAVQRRMHRLVFLMHPDHDLRLADVSIGDDARLLAAFKSLLAADRFVYYFRSAEELRALVIDALAHLFTSPQVDPGRWATPSPVPKPPSPFAPTHYTLLQTSSLIGRTRELRTIRRWLSSAGEEAPGAGTPRILCFRSMGGAGKSALAWHTFHQEAMRIDYLAGRLWWSFYDNDGGLPSFLQKAAQYVLGASEADVRRMGLAEQEARLLDALDARPFLVVLDGIERILNAYVRLDAARIDDWVPDWKTDAHFPTERTLRLCADTRFRRFLVRLSRLARSRVLMTTRLTPGELETSAGQPIPGVEVVDLKGLEDSDAEKLFEAIGGGRSSHELKRALRRFGSHPLLIQTLATQVSRYRPAPGDYDAWADANSALEPSELNLKQARSHILACALKDLSPHTLTTLRLIAHFRGPVSYRLLADLLVKTTGGFGAESELDKCLTEAEERGLVGWDRHRNTYDMHPIIRSVVWGLRRADDAERISGYFEATPLAQRSVVTSVDDLQPALELYALFVARGLVEDAFEIYARRLRPSLTRLVAGSTSIAVLREFTNHDGGVRGDIRNPSHRVTVLRDLAHAHMVSGSPLPAQQLLLHAVEEGLLRRDLGAVSVGLRNLAIACFVVGDLEAAFRAFERGRSIIESFRAKSQPTWTSWHDAESAIWEGLVLGAVGRYEDAHTSMDAGAALAMDAGSGSLEVIADCFRARVELWCAAPRRAMERVLNARLVAESLGRERDTIHADVIAAAAAIDMGDVDAAIVHVTRAVDRATAVNYISGELPARVQQGRLQRLQKEATTARQTISEVIARSEACGYRLELVDAYNVLASLAADEGDIKDAVGCARRALELADCDGPGLRYEPGAARAAQSLSELGEPRIDPRSERRSGSQATLERLERLTW